MVIPTSAYRSVTLFVIGINNYGGKITDTQCLKNLLPSKRTDRSLRQRGQDYKLRSLIGSFTVALELIHSNIGGIRQSAYNLIFLVETTQ